MTMVHAVRSRSLKSVLDFKIDTKDSLPRRLANLLYWASEEMPGRAIAKTHAAKIVLVLPRLPNEDSKDVKKISGVTAAARKILEDEHQRGLLTIFGMGIRATTNSEDTAKTQYERNAKRVVSAVTTLDKTRSIIKTSEIKDQDLRNRVAEIGKAAKILISPDVIDRLRLPAVEKDEKKKG